jgi:hypothetical protein
MGIQKIILIFTDTLKEKKEGLQNYFWFCSTYGTIYKFCIAVEKP